jgi:hypothetical protein
MSEAAIADQVASAWSATSRQTGFCLPILFILVLFDKRRNRGRHQYLRKRDLELSPVKTAFLAFCDFPGMATKAVEQTSRTRLDRQQAAVGRDLKEQEAFLSFAATTRLSEAISERWMSSVGASRQTSVQV